MTTQIAGTPPEGGEAPLEGAAPAAPAAGTLDLSGEVTTLRSRNAGLDAKVTELTKSQRDAVARAEAAEARALALAEGRENGDAELRAQAEALKGELAQARKDALLARIESKYPESFAVLGDAVAALTEDQLAANEARLKGVAGEPPESPKPMGNNAPRQQGAAPKAVEDMSLAELRAHLASFDPSVVFGPRSND